MELTIAQIRERRLDHNVGKGLCYVAYNVVTGELDKIFSEGNEAWEYARGKSHIYSVNSSNSVHTPRHIHLQITPHAQLDFFLDGYIDDGTLARHDKLRKQVLKREGKIVVD
jgi:hypothetical protein